MRVDSSRYSFCRLAHGFTKAWWLVGCVIVSLLVIAVVIRYGESRLQTDYSMGFSDDGFKRVTAGMSVEDVFDQLGPPLLFRVPSLGSSGYFTNLADARPVLSGATNEVVLEYSRARKGDTFRARQIVVRSSRVVKVDSYEYWGD